MAQVTVQQLAEVVGASVDRLLTQMGEAGLPHTQGDQAVSDEDKQTLLAYLKQSHGATTGAPKKIVLKRKSTSTIKTTGIRGRKTVNVEVRKKRTYLKRGRAEDAPPMDAEAIAEPALREVEPGDNRSDSRLDNRIEVDPEVLRRKAAAKRRKQEEDERAAREAAQKAEQQAKREEAERARTGAEPEPAPPPPPDELKQARENRRRAAQEPARDDRRDRPDRTDRNKRRHGRSDRPQEHVRGKQRGHNLSLSQLEAAESGISRRAGRRKQAVKAHEEHGRHGFEMPTEQRVHEVALGQAISVGDLAQQMSVKAGEVIKELMQLGVMATINQVVDQDTAILVVEEMGHTYTLVSEDALEEKLEETLARHEGAEEPRAPVVTVMGHVDHGKTSLLDYIRKSQVVSGEAGGITQHIGAYHVETGHGMISFLDTPGHAAFTAMRARGARSTDIVVLVVAADDGVMPQTEEAIQHARAADVPLIVAVNKMDKEGADPERVRKELAEREVMSEDWGGDTQFVNVSAHTGEGIDKLLDAILLQAEILELKAPRDVPAQGIVIESRLDKGRGPVASLLVQSGTLRQGDIVLAGLQRGRVRAMLDENGLSVLEAGPSIPVEVLGLDGTPDAGDPFAAVQSEKQARDLAMFRQEKTRDTRLAHQHATRLDNMFESMTTGEKQTLNLVVKADVRGSLEALQSSLLDLGNEEVNVNLVSGGVGGITETDVNLAMTTGAVIMGFNVRADNASRKLVEKEQLDLRYYNVIYQLIDDVKQALGGMLTPERREEIVGIAEVREVFNSPRFGQVAGCMVVEGAMHRSRPIRVLRENVVIHEGELDSLRRFKDDASEVRSGMECGIGVKNYTDVKVGDQIEVYQVSEVARSL